MKPFQERNPITIGISSLLVLMLGLLTAFFYEDLPIVGGGTSYEARFSEAAGLQPEDEVRVAGVKVGKVTDVELAGSEVNVTFQAKDAWIGERSSAAIKIKTLLGQKYLSITPDGDKALSPSKPIPRQRTVAPYDVVEAFSGLSNTVGEINTDQLAKSFRTMSDTFSGTPPQVRGALDGLSQLSRTVASRDQQLSELLKRANNVSKTIADRNGEFEKLLADGNKLLGEVHKRRDAIHSLLVGTRELSVQVKGLIGENEQQIGPTLAQLDRVTAMLQRNQDNLDQSLHKFAPFVRVFANTLGNGRWFDTYICGLLPPALGPINQEGCRP